MAITPDSSIRDKAGKNIERRDFLRVAAASAAVSALQPRPLLGATPFTGDVLHSGQLQENQ